MLVLTRKQQQRIVIGGEIELVVLDIRGNRVKLGLTAPPEVSIRREELEPVREDFAIYQAAIAARGESRQTA